MNEPPQRDDWIMDLVATKPRQILGSVVHEGQLVKVWYRVPPGNRIKALFPGEFRALKKREIPQSPERSPNEASAKLGKRAGPQSKDKP